MATLPQFGDVAVLDGFSFSHLRSRSVGSSRRPSWLVRKINKLAGGGGQGASSSSSASASATSSSMREGRRRRKNGAGGYDDGGHGFVLPKVQVTPAPEEDATATAGGAGAAGDDSVVGDFAGPFWSETESGRSLARSNESLPEGKKEQQSSKKKAKKTRKK